MQFTYVYYYRDEDKEFKLIQMLHMYILKSYLYTVMVSIVCIAVGIELQC